MIARLVTLVLCCSALILGSDDAEARRRSSTRVALVPLFASGKGAAKVAGKTTRAMLKRLRKSRRTHVVLVSSRRAARMKECLQVPHCIQRVGKHLGVRYLIAGHVTRLGRQYHVDMRVIAGANGSVISSETFQAGNLWRAKSGGARVALRLVAKAKQGVRVATASTTATDVPTTGAGPLFSRSDAETAAATIEARDEENPLIPPEEQQKEEKKLAQLDVTPTAPVVAAPVVVHKEPGLVSRLATKRYWHAWTTAGVGVAALGAGLGFGVISMKANSSAVAAEYQREAWLNHDKAAKNALMANILYGVGGAAMVTSAVMFLIEHRKEMREKRNEQDISVDFQVAQQGGGIVVKGSF